MTFQFSLNCALRHREVVLLSYQGSFPLRVVVRPSYGVRSFHCDECETRNLPKNDTGNKTRVVLQILASKEAMYCEDMAKQCSYETRIAATGVIALLRRQKANRTRARVLPYYGCRKESTRIKGRKSSSQRQNQNHTSNQRIQPKHNR